MGDSERILSLERELDGLRDTLDRLSARETTSMPFQQVRLARAVAGPTSYPTSGATFYIDFLNGNFSKAPGTPSANYINRHGEAFELCHNLNGTLPEENSLLHVFEWDGHWWCESDSSDAMTGGGESTLGVVQICDTTTNDCCVFTGLQTMMEAGAITDPCTSDQRCSDLIWVMCENLTLLPEFDYEEAHSNYFRDFCGYGRYSGFEFDCRGESRPLWFIPCPCVCECPDKSETVEACYVGPSGENELNCTFPSISLQCIDVADPIVGGAIPGSEQRWWGEFSVSGQYPIMGRSWPIITPFMFMGESIDTVYITWEGGGDQDDPCDPANYGIWVNVNGDFFQYGGTFDLDPGGSLGVAQMMLGPGITCVPTVQRTFYYGLLALCDPTFQIPRVSPIAMYHLPGGSQDPTRVADTCSGLMIPVVGTQDYEDPEGSLAFEPTGPCCGVSPAFSVDANFGRTVVPTCSVVLPNDTNSVAVGYSAMEWHVLGGCVDFLESEYGPSGTGDLVTCDGNASHGLARWVFRWSSSAKDCDEEPCG